MLRSVLTASFLISGLLAVAIPVAGAEVNPRAAAINEDIEEVVVTARRREGSGGGRRTAATREQLERSDETDMAGFFDDIDGLSTLGADGEGNAFSIDGMSADLGNVTLNGQGLGEGRGSGGFSVGDLPPEMIRRVDVFKLPSASMEEGGSAGSVDLQLRNPATIVRYTISGKARLAYVPDDRRLNPSSSVFSGGPSAGRTFGHMLTASVSENQRAYASQDISRWIAGTFDGQPAFYPGQVRNSEIVDTRSDGFAGLVLGFRPNDALDIGMNLFLSRKDRAIRNHGVQYRFEKQRELDALALGPRFVTELDSSDRSRSNLRITGSQRNDRVDSVLLGLDANLRLEKWRLNGALGHGSDENSSVEPARTAMFAAASAFGYRARSDGGLETRDNNGFSPVSAFAMSHINLSDRSSEDDNTFGALDATRTLGGVFRRVRIGWKARESARERRNSTGRAPAGAGLTLEDFFAGRYRQTPWDSNPWPGSDLRAVDEYLRDQDIEWKENLLNEYDMARRTNAAYLQLDFRADRGEQRFLAGNAGVRVVDTRTRIDGYRQGGESLEPFRQVTDSTDFLPSLVTRIRLVERTVLTVGAARVMTHPAFNDLAPGIRLKYADRTARAGNPDLEPFRANQFLSELTWGGNGRRVTVNLAWRDVQTYFALGEESIEFEDDVFLVTRPINGQDGSLLTAGVKLDQNLGRLSRRMQGYSVSLRYVHNHGRTEMKDPFTGETLPLPNTAEHVARADLVYGRNRFTGKLSYQWRGESLKASVSESGLSVWNRPSGSLNLNLGWNLGDGIRFNLDGRNLLAEEQLQSTDDDEQLWRITERDRVLAATLSAKW